MRRIFFLLFVMVGVAGPVLAQDGQHEHLVAYFLNKRQAMVRDSKVDVAEMSRTVRAAVNEASLLYAAGNYRAALDKISELTKYGALMDLPSFDVHMVLTQLYTKSSDPTNAAAHRARAEAMRDLLGRRIGLGQTPDDPLRAISTNDVIEWSRINQHRISDTKMYPYKGRELHAAIYSGPQTGNQQKTLYFEIVQNVRSVSQQPDLFAPIPVAQMVPQHRTLLATAQAKRQRFLDDTSFAYDELAAAVREAIKKATELAGQGKSSDALAALRQVEKIRPIEDIPTPELISVYSALHGRIGDNKKQIELREYLFGINQAIAHSGDGLTPATAVHVILTSEEYAWLREKKLTFLGQRVHQTPSGKFDVMKARDASGAERDYFFNITRLYQKYGQGTWGKPQAPVTPSR